MAQHKAQHSTPFCRVYTADSSLDDDHGSFFSSRNIRCPFTSPMSSPILRLAMPVTVCSLNTVVSNSVRFNGSYISNIRLFYTINTLTDVPPFQTFFSPPPQTTSNPQRVFPLSPIFDKKYDFLPSRDFAYKAAHPRRLHHTHVSGFRQSH